MAADLAAERPWRLPRVSEVEELVGSSRDGAEPRMLNASKIDRLRKSRRDEPWPQADDSMELDRKTEDLLRKCDELLGRNPQPSTATSPPRTKSPPRRTSPLTESMVAQLGDDDFFVSPATSVDFDGGSHQADPVDVPPPEAATQTARVDSGDAATQTTRPATTCRDAAVGGEAPSSEEASDEDLDALLERAAHFADDDVVAALVTRLRAIRGRLF
mmetsp:Transcript_6614/g.17283  ORF Transcript_6614/g.17283 Transcript_6614/m.17283 type:complete len:216 (+) Transcript_6614:32-679(+)